MLPACGGRTRGPSLDLAAPTFVSVPDDPADDPQLAALDGLIDDTGEDVGGSPGICAEQLAAFSHLVTGLRGRLASDAQVAGVRLDYPTVAIRSDNGLTNWTRPPDSGLLSHPMSDYRAEQFGDASLDLNLVDLDPEVPQRVVAGINRRTSRPCVASIELSGRDATRLTWHFVVETGRAPATVVAEVDGSVVAVKWWE